MEKQPASPARLMRWMKLSFVICGLLIIGIAIRIPVQSQHAPDPAFELAIAILALATVIAGFAAPRFFERVARPAPEGRPDSTALNRWVTKNVFSLACLNACNLLGFVLNRVGGRVRLVEAVFTIGMIALLAWSPGIPPAADENRSGVSVA